MAGKTIDQIGKDIEDALNNYAKKHGQPPNVIRLRKDIDEALHQSRLAFQFDFVDLLCSRERFMGMDVELINDGPEFIIESAEND